MPVTRTGIRLTADERDRVFAPVPYIVPSGGAPPASPQQKLHSIALAKGLPEIRGYYGCTEDGEITYVAEDADE